MNTYQIDDFNFIYTKYTVPNSLVEKNRSGEYVTDLYL